MILYKGETDSNKKQQGKKRIVTARDGRYDCFQRIILSKFSVL